MTNVIVLSAFVVGGCGGEETPDAGTSDVRGASDGAGDSIFLPRKEVSVSPSVQDNLRRRDAENDEWSTEVLHERAKEKQSELLAWLCEHQTAAGDRAELDEILAREFEGLSVLRPELEQVFDDGFTRVLRPVGYDGGLVTRDRMDGLARELRGPFGSEEIHPHFKIKTVDMRGERRFRTDVLVYLDGATVQQNMEWRQDWVLEAKGVRLASLRLIAFEEVRSKGALLTDRTGYVFENFAQFYREFLHGVEHYRGRVDALIGQPAQGMQGIAVGDVDGDGRDDLYVPQQAGTPNRLFLCGDDGRAVDVTARSAAGILELTRSALLIDWDNDGDQDLVAAIGGPGILTAQNDGTGRFRKMRLYAVEETGQIYSMSAADADGDGDLDIYCCRYADEGILHSVPVPYHDANNGVPNILFRNDDGVFVDATSEFGLDVNNNKFSLASIWEDFDGDGDLDLYVANDYGRNNLYRNDGGHFTDVAEEVGCDDMAAGMGVSVSDVDADGDMDIYVTNMFSSAGLRIASQNDRFMDGANQDVHTHYQRHARGNTLLLNRGDGTFEDVTVESSASVAGWSWGSQFLDLNNDGMEDIYAPNGFLTNPDTGDL